MPPNPTPREPASQILIPMTTTLTHHLPYQTPYVNSPATRPASSPAQFSKVVDKERGQEGTRMTSSPRTDYTQGRGDSPNKAILPLHLIPQTLALRLRIQVPQSLLALSAREGKGKNPVRSSGCPHPIRSTSTTDAHKVSKGSNRS